MGTRPTRAGAFEGAVAGILPLHPGEGSDLAWGADASGRVLQARGISFLGAGRVDNRAELPGTPGAARPTDADVMCQAYLRWGEEAPSRILGDWAFAAWHPRERKLFLARDHFGNAAIYYCYRPGVFAFSSSRRDLLAMNLAPMELDELYLAQVLVSWTAYHGERTIRSSIKRLPPAHCLTVTPGRLSVRCYWRPDDAPELHLAGRGEYVEAFREVFDEAVRARLVVSGERGLIGATLSGGLDSGSVSATAATFLRAQGRDPLLAFTSAPLSDPSPYVGGRFGDEVPLATTTARHAGHTELRTVKAEHASPVGAIRRMLEIWDEPAHAAGNAFWLLAIMQSARDAGCEVLLTGQMGNAGVSWTGDIGSQRLGYQLRQRGWRATARDRLRRTGAGTALVRRRRRSRGDPEGHRSSAIHPAFAVRMNLLERRLSDPDEWPARTPMETRLRILKPGRSLGGGINAAMGAAFGLDIRDPTADARVLAFTLSVPDRVFIDPQRGLDRWLIREAMKGRLPDEVRLNRRRGRQSGDLVPRLRAHASDVEEALDELDRGPAAEYVDVPYLRDVWGTIQAEDTPNAFRQAVTILTRGIMAGLWVNGFDRDGRRMDSGPSVPAE